MKCPHPITLKGDNSNEARIRRIIQGQNDIQGSYQVPCGKCYVCLGKRRADWAFRLHAEALASDTTDTLFITITYDDESVVQVDYLVRKRELQTLFKELRNSGCMFKYYAIGEYGSHTHRPHFHAMIFLKAKDGLVTDRVQFVNNLEYYWQVFDSKNSPVKSKGFIKVDDISPARVNYVLHYHIRPKEVPGEAPELYETNKDGQPVLVGKPFAISSQGLGLEFISNPALLETLRNSDEMVVHDMFQRSGRLPRYYRKKFGLQTTDKMIDQRPWPTNHEGNFNYLWSYRDLMKDKFKKYNVQEKF